MPYIFISAVALCANLYRCAPLIVGDKYADPELMKFLGAKITTDYPEPNSPPMYVMFATMRSVLDALQEIGYDLKSSQVVQGYTTWIMSKPAEGDVQPLKSDSTIKPDKSTDELQQEPEVTASKPRRRNPKKKDKSQDEKGSQRCYELSAEESAELRAASSRSIRRGREKDDSHPYSRDTSYKRIPRSESGYAREKASQRRPISDVDESTSTRDLQSRSSKRLLATESGVARELSKRQMAEHEESNKDLHGRRSSKDLHDLSKREMKTGSEISKPESSFTKRPEMKREEPSKISEQEQKNLEPKESQIEENQESETKPKTTDKPSEGPLNNRGKVKKWSSDVDTPDKTSKHKGTKPTGRKTSTPVKENFKK